MNNRTYAIVDIAAKNNVNYSQVLQTNANTVRQNVSGSEFIIKWNNTEPSTVIDLRASGSLITYNSQDTHNHSEILTIISDVEWTPSGSF